MDLVSLADLKTFMQKPGATDDSILAIVLSQVSSDLETYMNRQLEKKVRTVYFNKGRKSYDLQAFPIDLIAPPVVTVSGTVKTLNTDYVIWDTEGFIEFQNVVVSTKLRPIEIVYTGGYAPDGGNGNALLVPDDMKLAALLQASYTFLRRDIPGGTSITRPSGGQSFVGGLDLVDRVKKILDRHRKSATEF